jgi:hypothetical protein
VVSDRAGVYPPARGLRKEGLSMTVGIMTPESTGSGENWSSSRQNLVVAKIVEGLQWWKDNALAPANLTFVYDIHQSVATTF